MKHTDSPWNGTRETEFGNNIILSSTGVPICEMLFSDGLGTDAKVRKETEANELIIRQSVAMKEELASILKDLKGLKAGTMSIFDFPIEDHIKEMTNIISKSEE